MSNHYLARRGRLMGVIATLILGFAHPAEAETKPMFPMLDCPGIGTEFEKMLANLDSIKTSIKGDANCANVSLKVGSLQDLVTKDREAVMDIVRSVTGQSMSAEQSAVIRNYAENLTKQVTALNDLFTQSNYCFRGDQPEQSLASLAGFVGEAAQLVGSLAGPWGTPVSLSGNVVAGFLTGLDQVLKSRAGYDFKRVEQWRSYVNNLCTYHNYRDQIAHLLNPQGRLQELSVLREKLEHQVSVMARECPECQKILNEFPAHKNEGEKALWSLFNPNIAAADQHSPKPYGSYTMQSLGVLEWVIGEMARIQQESQTYWADASGKYLLANAKADIENFLVEKEGAKFVRFGVEKSMLDYFDFTDFISKDLVAGQGRTLYINLESAHSGLLKGRIPNIYWTTPLEVFRALIIEPVDWSTMPDELKKEDLQYAWQHFREESLNRYTRTQSSMRMVKTFCSFYQRAGFYSPGIRSECRKPYFATQNQHMNLLAKELEEAGVVKSPAPMPEEGTEERGLSRIQSMTKTVDLRGIGN